LMRRTFCSTSTLTLARKALSLRNSQHTGTGAIVNVCITGCACRAAAAVLDTPDLTACFLTAQGNACQHGTLMLAAARQEQARTRILGTSSTGLVTTPGVGCACKHGLLPDQQAGRICIVVEGVRHVPTASLQAGHA
jgi:hypothetical protein